MKINIIIPVYNCEKYIERCLDSVLNQTYHDFEIIAINDGSNDRSLSILNTYKAKYPNKIHLIDQQNAGAPAARNRGIEAADGDYVTFIDSDDYIDNNFLETMIANIMDEDVIISGYKKTDSQGNVLFSKTPKNCYWSLYKYPTNWSNFYKVDFLKKHNIRFPNFRIGEDCSLTFQCITTLKSYKIVDYAGYYYFTNEESVTKTIKTIQNVNSLKDLLISFDKTALAANYHEYKEMYYYFLKTSIFNLYLQRKGLALNVLKQLFIEEYRLIKEMKSLKPYKKGFVFEKDEDFFVNIIINAFLLAYKTHTLSLLIAVLKLI